MECENDARQYVKTRDGEDFDEVADITFARHIIAIRRKIRYDIKTLGEDSVNDDGLLASLVALRALIVAGEKLKYGRVVVSSEVGWWEDVYCKWLADRQAKSRKKSGRGDLLERVKAEFSRLRKPSVKYPQWMW